MMDNKDLDVEKALDELFGGEFIDKDEEVLNENTNTYSSLDKNNIIFMDFESNVIINDNNLTSESNNIKEDINCNNETFKDEVVFDMNNLDKILENANIEDTIIPQPIVSVENNNSNVDEIVINPNVSEDKVDNKNLEETIIPEIFKPIEEEIVNENVVTNNLENNNEIIFPYEKVKNEEYIEKKQNRPEILKYILIGIIILISFISIVVLIAKVTTPGTIKCTYKADTDEFTLTDEYEIDYKSNEILSVIGEYKYRSKTEDFNKEIQYIKDAKIPVIVNSNGMPGFTYIYEVEDEIIKVYTYLDFTMFDYDEISKVNQKITPISYFSIEKNMKIKDLKKKLENKGYICK